jgi:lysosomal Pro-X carboxypeptidase
VTANPGTGNCSELWFTNTIDHFSWTAPPTGAFTYQQRYFVNDAYWRNGTAGAIFFYAGNEADVTLYVNNTGLMWENAASFGALLVWAEHRYFGASQPFGAASGQYLGYLTSEQAMADYAALIYDIQARYAGAASPQPVIAFGGSYGGMLAAWFRTHYPGVITGAIAASAPIRGFATGLAPAWDSESYWAVVTADASAAGGAAPACAGNIRASWDAIFDAGATPAGRAGLASTFALCAPLNDNYDVFALAEFLLNAWDTMAMGSYPYASSYLTGGAALLPPYPLRQACGLLADGGLANNSAALLAAINAAAGVFNNATSNVACYGLPTGDIFEDGIWDYLWCTEQLPEETYFTRDGVNDMFWPFTFNASQVDAHCQGKYGVTPRRLWVPASYGASARLGATNIFLSQGALDPWSSGGLLVPQPGVTVAVIPESGHHLDLFFTNAADPANLTATRAAEMAAITQWIAAYWDAR